VAEAGESGRETRRESRPYCRRRWRRQQHSTASPSARAPTLTHTHARLRIRALEQHAPLGRSTPTIGGAVVIVGEMRPAATAAQPPRRPPAQPPSLAFSWLTT
jgi:hypothetical protein